MGMCVFRLRSLETVGTVTGMTTPTKTRPLNPTNLYELHPDACRSCHEVQPEGSLVNMRCGDCAAELRELAERFDSFGTPEPKAAAR